MSDMPQDWLSAFAEQGVPNWAALQAWNEAQDSDTVMQIKARARHIAATHPTPDVHRGRSAHDRQEQA